MYLRLGEVDKAALLLGEVLRGPLLVLPVALVLEHLNLIGASEIISATGRDVWHGSLEITVQRHYSSLTTWHHYLHPHRRRDILLSSTATRRHGTDTATLYFPAALPSH